MKRYYECTFIVNPGLDDPQIDSVVNGVEDAVVKNGGEIVEKELLGRRRLAYPIAKKHNGYYATLEFNAEPHVIDKVERFMTLEENVMRYLTLQLEPRELEMKQLRVAKAKEAELEKLAQEAGPSGDTRVQPEKAATTDAAPAATPAKSEAASDEPEADPATSTEAETDTVKDPVEEVKAEEVKAEAEEEVKAEAAPSEEDTKAADA